MYFATLHLRGHNKSDVNIFTVGYCGLRITTWVHLSVSSEPSDVFVETPLLGFPRKLPKKGSEARKGTGGISLDNPRFGAGLAGVGEAGPGGATDVPGGPEVGRVGERESFCPFPPSSVVKMAAAGVEGASP